MEANDVFIDYNDYVICLIYFTTTSENVFKFGKPFLKKYLFTFNYDSKKVYFYSTAGNGKENDGRENGNGNKKDNKVSIVILVISIFATIIVVSIICYLIFKYFLYDKFFRKKRASELDDDDYEYTSKEDLGKDALNINYE